MIPTPPTFRTLSDGSHRCDKCNRELYKSGPWNTFRFVACVLYCAGCDAEWDAAGEAITYYDPHLQRRIPVGTADYRELPRGPLAWNLERRS